MCGSATKLLVDPTTTIEPPPDRSIAAAAARQDRNAPRTLVRKTSSHVSSVVSRNGTTRWMPAFDTWTSSRPKRVSAPSMRRSTSPASPTSPAMARTRSGAPRVSAVAARRPASRASRATLAPSRTNSSAMPRPIPVDPPVIVATRPASRPVASSTASLYPREVSPTLRPSEEDRAIAHRGDGYRIGIDAATGVVRVAALRDGDGRVLASATSPFEVASDGARREVDFLGVEAAVRDALSAVVTIVPEGLDAISVGIAATASTVAVADRGDGQPHGHGLMWADHRANREAAAIRRAGHPNFVRMLGHVSPEWGIAKLAWLAGSGALDRSSGVVVELADWLGFRASGVWAANAGTREWGWAGGDDGAVDPALIEAAAVPRAAAGWVLDDVRATGAVLGVVQDEAGWPRVLRGVPVLVGGMDSYLAALGMGAAASGRLCLTVGSSSAAIGGVASGDATGRMFGPLRNAVPGLTEGAWQGGQTTAGLAAGWARRVLGGPEGALEEAAADAPPGSRDV